MKGADYDDADECGPSDNICYSINQLGLGATKPLTVPRKHFIKALQKFTEKANTSFT